MAAYFLDSFFSLGSRHLVKGLQEAIAILIDRVDVTLN
jgi:hypothetical protein